MTERGYSLGRKTYRGNWLPLTQKLQKKSRTEHPAPEDARAATTGLGNRRTGLRHSRTKKRRPLNTVQTATVQDSPTSLKAHHYGTACYSFSNVAERSPELLIPAGLLLSTHHPVPIFTGPLHQIRTQPSWHKHPGSRPASFPKTSTRQILPYDSGVQLRQSSTAYGSVSSVPFVD